MSVRAYRIIEIKRAENPSFNLQDNNKLTQFINEKTNFIYSLNSYGSGMIEVPLTILEKALKTPKKLDIDGETAKQLQEDIEFAKAKHNEYVVYDCF